MSIFFGKMSTDTKTTGSSNESVNTNAFVSAHSVDTLVIQVTANVCFFTLVNVIAICAVARVAKVADTLK